MTPVPVLYLHEHAEISGGETSLLVLWEHLDRRRYRPALLGPAEGPLVERARRLDVPAYSAEFPRFRGALTPRGWRCLAAVVRRVHDLAPAILHGNTPHTNFAAAWAGRRLGRRVVWHERTLLEPGEWDVDRWLRRLPNRIVCNSAAVARRFGGPGRRVVVVLNGVPLQRFAPDAGGAALRRALGIGPEEVALGIVGNFSPWKNHELFLRAAALLADGTPRARFLIVGGEVFPENRGREAALRDGAARLNLAGRVGFLGVREDMPAVMDALDVLVSAAEVEACSRAILEAMACGTPVVAADAGGNPELVAPGETGLLFPHGDAHALAAALRTLTEDDTLRKTMGAAARARAEAQFGIERQVREIEAVYDTLMEER
jgi:glycosyltransferase involved in cell wall biosynthesis